MPKVIVTGGCGYIGSHTVVDLAENGFDVICIDSNVRSDVAILDGIVQILGKNIQHYSIDLCNRDKVLEVLAEHQDSIGIIHFAAFKSVPESVQKPLMYYHNNINGLLNILFAIEQFNIPYLIFSSSCSVYGNTSELPVRETTPFGRAESPYAHTKQIGEQMCLNATIANANLKAVMLRYFNPAGAHPSICIGEIPQVGAYNVVPLIMESLQGLRGTFTVTGGDYETPDGSCIRDYIHVSDVAHAHTKALEYLMNNQNTARHEVFNIGIGKGISVIELLDAFERANGVHVPRIIGQRRPGDVQTIYADTIAAQKTLHWQPRYSIEDMLRTAWQWEQKRRRVLLP